MSLKMVANTGLKGPHIANSSTCLYIWLLNLSSVPCVAISIACLNLSSGIGRKYRWPQYKAQPKIAMVLNNGTFVNRLLMSKEHRSVLTGSILQFSIKFVHRKEFGTGTNISANHLASPYREEPIIDKDRLYQKQQWFG